MDVYIATLISGILALLMGVIEEKVTLGIIGFLIAMNLEINFSQKEKIRMLFTLEKMKYEQETGKDFEKEYEKLGSK